MSQAPWIKQLRLAACVAAVALAALAAGWGGAAWAQAADEDDDDEIENSILNTDKRLIDSFLGSIGLISTTPGIRYRERSPLVVPSGRDLPPPGGKLTKNPDWPVDPEVKKKRDAAAARKSGRTVTPRDPSKPISGTDEMYRVDTTGKWDESGKNTKRDPSFIEMIQSGKMFSGSFAAKEEVGTFTGERPRASLAEPPPGYLTPSPAAPYGVTPREMLIPKKDPKL